MELSRAQQVMLMFNNNIIINIMLLYGMVMHIISLCSTKTGYGAQLRRFFQKERGRTVKNFEVEKILESFQHRFEEREGRAEDDKEGIIIDHALSSLEPPQDLLEACYFYGRQDIHRGHCPRASKLLFCYKR